LGWEGMGRHARARRGTGSHFNLHATLHTIGDGSQIAPGSTKGPYKDMAGDTYTEMDDEVPDEIYDKFSRDVYEMDKEGQVIECVMSKSEWKKFRKEVEVPPRDKRSKTSHHTPHSTAMHQSSPHRFVPHRTTPHPPPSTSTAAHATLHTRTFLRSTRRTSRSLESRLQTSGTSLQ